MSVLFSAWGYDVTALEFSSVVIAFAAIALGIKGTRWTWPLYFVSSLLYGWLFIEFDLYASAAMNGVFMLAAVWGWFSWGREGVRVPGRLTVKQRVTLAAGGLVVWAALTPLLQSVGGAATWGDAFMFVGSLVAQLLMVFEKVDAWPSWIVVNVAGTALFSSQGLYFTALFYAALVVMAIVGWRQWSTRDVTPATPTQTQLPTRV